MHSQYTQGVFQTLDRVVCLFACLIVVGVTPAFAKRTLTLEQCQVISSGVNERITSELRIPRPTGHRFHEDLDSDSMRIWTAIPRQPGHLLERGLAGR
jgi:hypothetical protein